MSKMKQTLRSMPILRGGFSLLAHWRMRRYFDLIGLTNVEDRTRKILPSLVRKGPFAGLKLADQACGSVWIPKMLGCYEMELAFAVEEIVKIRPDVIVDVGCAEGYFAVGLALRIATAKIFAADTNPFARRMVRQIARLNNVRDRVETTCWITPKRLNGLLTTAQRPAVWCDIEGGEWDLMDPEKIPALRKAWIVIENHQHSTGFPLSALAARFSSTHESQFIDQSARLPSDWMPQELAHSFSESETKLAMAELRPSHQQWMYLRPRESGAPGPVSES